MKTRVAVALMFAFSFVGAAHAQVKAGTIIVFQLTQDEFVIAADSRTVFDDRPPDDTRCKIRALDRQFVVAVSAVPIYVPGLNDVFPVPAWNSTEEAKTIGQRFISGLPEGSTETVNAIADAWAVDVQSKWIGLNTFYPDRVRTVAGREGGILTNGLFAFAQNGQISVAAGLITLGSSGIQYSRVGLPSCMTEPCATGKTQVAGEFIRVTSERARQEKAHFTASAKLLARASAATIRVVRLADLTIAYDNSGTVHEPIDGLELFNDGSIRWFSRKDDCPAN